MSWLVIAGIVIFFVGLMASIALHELGHLSFAKLFGVRTTQYMVGFGPTMWSRHRGETEYGFKWIPLGGYIRMIGMLPPRKEDAPGRVRKSSTGPFQGLIEGARGAALEEVRPGDENRVFYSKPWWQKFLIMVAGPAANFVFATVIFAIVLIGIGLPKTQPVVEGVNDCVIPASQGNRACQPGDQPTPAKGKLQPGDRFVSYGGQKFESVGQLRKLIRESGGKNTPLVVERDGKQVPLQIQPIINDVYALDNPDDPDKVVKAGFIGFSFGKERERQGPDAVATVMWDATSKTAGAMLHIPEKMVRVWHAAFSGEERDKDSPIGVVGASRIGGEIAAAEETPPIERVATFLLMLAAFNIAVGVFNLVPLLPLDGGHIAGALWEAVKRFMARILKRPDPGYVDVAKALPVAYAIAGVIILMGVLLIYADLVNPVRIT